MKVIFDFGGVIRGGDMIADSGWYSNVINISNVEASIFKKIKVTKDERNFT